MVEIDRWRMAAADLGLLRKSTQATTTYSGVKLMVSPDAYMPRSDPTSTTRAAALPGDLEGYTDQCQTFSKTGSVFKAQVSLLPHLRSHRTQPTVGQGIYAIVLYPAAKDCLTKRTHYQGPLCFSPNKQSPNNISSRHKSRKIPVYSL